LKEKTEVKVVVENNVEAVELFGEHDQNLKIIEKELAVQIVARGSELLVIGEKENVDKVVSLFQELTYLLRCGQRITQQQVQYAINLCKEGNSAKLREFCNDVINITAHGKQVKPKTLGQIKYIEALKKNDIVFAIGPAGTGKTYLAIAMAVSALKNKSINRIVLTRPAVEAGEKLGFLPGDLQEKVDPYLRPLYDALYDILGAETFQKFQERRIIEVAPLAYMRGRTLDDSFIILDEAQNTTSEQMKMFLTRLGFGSKAVITGDITQIDLPKGQTSGLKKAIEILDNINGIAFAYLTDKDVVRHELVRQIIRAYEKYEKAH